MWSVFKIANFIWLMSSTYMWMTTFISLTPIVFICNILMIVSLGFLPIKVEFGKSIGRILLAICALVIWSVLTDGYVMGIFTFMCYIPVVWLIMLPKEYMRDLLDFTTKWYAIMLAIGLVEYFILLFASLPSIGGFEYPGYEPFVNYGFYLKTTFDYGTFERFNGFLLEPGHQALLSTFLLIANSFKLKGKPFNCILLAGVIFSFSLAGYMLAAVAWSFFFVKNMKRALFVVALVAALVAISLSWNYGDNTLNELIISRLEYDEEKGIKGNNRYFNNTDFVFERANKDGRAFLGVQNKVNMELVGGAGFKIYVIKYGWLGVILAGLFYLSVIPAGANRKYTATFFIVLALCFMQRAYPAWYSWLLPYILGIYIHRNEDEVIEK